MFYIVMTYDPRAGSVVTEKVFSDAVQAEEEYVRAESVLDMGDDAEVVLIGTESRETVLATHGHYFRSRLETPWSWILEGLE